MAEKPVKPELHEKKHHLMFTKVIYLDRARTNEMIKLAGDFLYVEDMTGVLKVRFDVKHGSLVELEKEDVHEVKFSKLWLTNTAQSGKSCTLWIGTEKIYKFLSGGVAIKALKFGGSGQKTVTAAGTAEALASATRCASVTIKALHGNTNNVYVGGSTVSSTTGFVLDAGETVSLDVDELSDIYLDVDTNGEGVSYIWLK